MRKKIIHGNAVKKTAKSWYFIPSHMFTFHSLVKLVMPKVKFDGVIQPISEYKMVHGLI